MLAPADRDLAVTLVAHARAAHRLRFEVEGLVGNPLLGDAIEASARARPGVTRVAADPHSGRVLVEYAPGAPVLAELERFARGAPRRGRVAVQEDAAWHALPVDAVARAQHTDLARGLAFEEAARRLDRFGANAVEDDAPSSRLRLLADQLANLPTGLLLGSALVSLLLGDFAETGAIVAVVGLNAAIGYRIERRTEELLASWRVAEAGTTEVIRGASMCRIPAVQLVPGDLVVVRAGAVVTADARVVDAHRLAVDEAALTGESEPAAKHAAPVPEGVALADRRSMLYRGTTIASGHGRAIVIATGPATEIANVQRLADRARAPKATLQRRLDALTSKLAWGGMAASAVSGLASLAWRVSPLAIVRESVAIAVAAIPEGLPVTATAALVRAMSRLRDRGVIVRKLATAETVGGVTVACTDKTGTLTENQMRLEAIAIAGRDGVRRIPAEALGSPVPASGVVGALLVAGVLNSDLDYLRNGHGALEIAGSATERALAEAAQRAGLDPRRLRELWPRRRLIERRDGVNYVVSEHAGELAFVKGAPEQVVPLCDLTPELAARVLDENAVLAGDGLRVLAIGWRPIADGPWRFLGLVALRDPVREGAPEAIRDAARAGVRTMMLTGDQARTARAIAKRVGLTGDVIEAGELPAVLSAPDTDARLRRIAVIARVTPADKVAVVEALRRAGEIVAMAGDGVNDAPALRAAHVGIAVGVRATDLARQTADIVLEHEDLRSILTAIAEGRVVQDNLRRAIRFQAAGNLAEIALVLAASLAGRRLVPSMGLLWINLLTDTLPGLALALEPGDGRALDRPPAVPGAPILARSDWKRIARDGAAMAAASGAAAVLGGPLAAFGAIGTVQFGYAVSQRAPVEPRPRRFGWMIGGSLVLHLTAVASAPMRALLRLAGGAPIALAASTVAASAPLYLAWRKQAAREISRRGDATRQETSP